MNKKLRYIHLKQSHVGQNGDNSKFIKILIFVLSVLEWNLIKWVKQLGEDRYF